MLNWLRRDRTADKNQIPTTPTTTAPDANVPATAAPQAQATRTGEPEGIETTTQAPQPPAQSPPPKSWLGKLRAGLERSAQRLSSGISGIFTRRRLDAVSLEELEDLLIQADLGPAMAKRITAELARTRLDRDVTSEEVRGYLAQEIQQVLEPVARPFTVDRSHKPFVVLMAGVNGTGKTTTIGKLAKQMASDGLKVTLAAGDTFRAAAVSQLQIWGERTGARVIARQDKADPAGLAYDALMAAREADDDVLLIDTAGRLHNKENLMAELAKIVRVLQKLDPEAPHATILTLDATTGQNAINQVQIFKDIVNITGLVVTKLDGSAKGGIVVALAERFGLPVHAVGVGEQADDLRAFDAGAFARSLVGLDGEK